MLSLAALADTATDDLVEVTVKPNFRALGKRFGGRTQTVARAIAAAGARPLADALGTGTATVDVDGEPVTITGEDVVVTETPRSGWAVASDGPETVALDLELTHELRLAGLARDIVRLVQDARKNAGYQVTDRVELWWRVGGSPAPAEAIRAHTDLLSTEVLATRFTEGPPPEGTDGLAELVDEELGLHVWLRRVR